MQASSSLFFLFILARMILYDLLCGSRHIKSADTYLIELSNSVKDVKSRMEYVLVRIYFFKRS